MFHTTSTGLFGKVVDESVSVEGAVVHPIGLGFDDAVHDWSQLLHVVVGSVSIHHDAVAASTLVEINFLELSDLYGGIDQPVVVFGAVDIFGNGERSGDAPSCRQG